MESAPWKIFSHNEKEIRIDVDGGITIDGVTKNPFPTSISHAAICSEGLIATWVDHDLRLARMALISLDEPIKEGITKGELRKRRNTEDVAGAIWCHTLDAEPLALTAQDDLIVFALWQRGIYAIKSDSTEIWRTGLPELDGKNPPRAEEISSIHINQDIHVWIRCGDHLIMDRETGAEKNGFTFQLEADIEDVFHHEGLFLLSAKDGLAYCSDGEKITEIQQLRGTIQDAKYDGESWRAICWRDDVTIGQVQPIQRKELGVQIIEQDGEWMVLDNQWDLTPHMTE